MRLVPPAPSGVAVTAPAEAEEPELVLRDVESVGLPDATPQTGEDLRLDEAPVEVFDVAAALADQVMVVSREGFGQLVAALPLRGIRRPHEADVAEQLDRPVHRDEVDALAAEAPVELRDRARLLARGERGQHGPPGPGDAVPAPSQEARDGVARVLEDRAPRRIHAHWVVRAGGSTPTAR
jgi:hypothetical protein